MPLVTNQRRQSISALTAMFPSAVLLPSSFGIIVKDACRQLSGSCLWHWSITFLCFASRSANEFTHVAGILFVHYCSLDFIQLSSVIQVCICHRHLFRHSICPQQFYTSRNVRVVVQYEPRCEIQVVNDCEFVLSKIVLS